MAEAPPPKRRLRAILVYLCILLAGGMGGGALAYNLLEELINHRTSEDLRPAAMKPKNDESVAATESNPEEAQAWRADAEKKLEEAQAGRVAAEKKLAVSLAEFTKSSAENQKKLDAAEKQLATLAPASRDSTSRKPTQAKTGNCVLNSGNVTALKGCLEDFNR